MQLSMQLWTAGTAINSEWRVPRSGKRTLVLAGVVDEQDMAFGFFVKSDPKLRCRGVNGS
jgi:hypothetical protein